MSLAEAWLVLIAGVSLLQGGIVEDAAVQPQLALNKNTCNRPKQGASDPSHYDHIDNKEFGLRCFGSKECSHETTNEWSLLPVAALDTCSAMVAIRPSRDNKNLMVVLQLRGTEVDHNAGIELLTGDNVATKKSFIKCYKNANKATIESNFGNEVSFGTGFEKSAIRNDQHTICEGILKSANEHFFAANSPLKEYIWLSYKEPSGGLKQFKMLRLTLQGLLRDSARCNFPTNDYGYVDAEKEFYLPVSIWEAKLECKRPGEKVENVDKYRVHYVDDNNNNRRLVKVNGATCDQTKYIAAIPPSINVDTDVGTRLMCVAKACSMCSQPPCDVEGHCPQFEKSDPEGKNPCVKLTCNGEEESYYIVDGRTAEKGIPKCEKKKKEGVTDETDQYDKRIEAAKGGKSYYGWTFKGQSAEKFVCGSKQKNDGCEQLIVGPSSKLTTNAQNVTCAKEKEKMQYKDGKVVDLLRLYCADGKWMQVYKMGDGNKTSEFPATGNETLHCEESDKGAAAKGSVPLMYVGAGAGVIALVAIVVVVVYFCCCKRRKKESAQKSKAASMTAMSSGDHVKKSESSQIKSAPAAPSSVPVTFEPIKEPKSKSGLVAPRSDNGSEQKKEDGTTKKEFLKFDDSNMSDIQNVSKKPDETDRLDLLQQEADKLSQEQKQKEQEKKKKAENLYPRLNDIDDDWNDSKEGEKKKEEKKEGAASDKTTIQSKLTSRPLKNAPHDDGQYEALGMQTVLMEKTAIGGTTGDDESGTSKKSNRTRTKMAIADGSKKGGDDSRKDGTSTGTKTGGPPKTELQTALDAKLADIEKTAIYNDDGVEEGGTQATGTRTKTVLATGKTKATTIAGTQSKDGRTTIGTTQGGVTGAGATTQRTRTQTRTRGDPTQIPSDGVTARDPTAQDETQMATDGMTAVGHTTADPTQMTDGRTAREVTANDGTQATDGRTAQELTPVDFTQGGTRTGRTAKELTAADFTQNRTTMTGRTARSATRGDDTQMPTTDGRTALTRTRATRTQDQTTRTADQETQDPTVINDPTQILTRTRRTSRTQDGTTAYDPTQDPTMLGDQTQLTEGRTGMTKTRASRTQMSRTGTTQDPTAFDPTQDPTAFDQTQLTGGGRTRTSRTQGATTATQADPTGMTQDQTTINDLTQLPTEGRTGMTKTRASRTQSQTRTGATQDQTGFDPTQDPTAFDQTQLTGGGRTRTTRTQAATTATQADPTRTGFTQDQTMVGEPTQLTDGGRTGVTRTRAKTTQEQTRDPTGTQEATMVDGATQMTDGRTGVTKTRASRTQDPTTAFDQTQVNTDGRTAVSRTKVTRTQDGTRTKDRTQEPTTAFDGTQTPTDAQTAVSRTKGRTTQGEITAAEGTPQTEGRTAVSRTKGRTTQGEITAAEGTPQTEGRTAVSRTKGRTTQAEITAAEGTPQTEGRTAVSRTKGRTTQDGATAFDGTQVATDGKTAVSRTKGRTTQDGATAFDGTQAQTEGQTAVSRTKGRTTQEATAVNDGTQAQTEGQTAVSRTKAGRTQEPSTAPTRGQTTRTQEPTTAPTRGQTTRTQEATAVTPQTTAGGRTAKERTRTKSQDGTRTPQDTQADGQTEAKTGSKERTTGASRTGAEATQATKQSRTGAEGPQTPSE